MDENRGLRTELEPAVSRGATARDDWETPQVLFDELDEEFHFTLDAAATVENAKCEKFFTIEEDGLTQDWSGVVWLNPPYGRGVDKWIAKARNESLRGCTVVILTFSRTDTRWFHDYVYHQAELRFLKGRLKFVGGKYSSPFPSMLIIFRGKEIPDGV